MQVTKHKVVAIDYTLRDDDAQVIDSSVGAEPLYYLHGADNIVPGLERALEGRVVGDRVEVVVPPAEGYGDRVAELRQVVSLEAFADVEELELGMQFRVATPDEQFVVVTVVEIGPDTVTVDGNHALAGMNLHFDVSVREIRDATADELEQGHAQVPGHEL